MWGTRRAASLHPMKAQKVLWNNIAGGTRTLKASPLNSRGYAAGAPTDFCAYTRSRL